MAVVIQRAADRAEGHPLEKERVRHLGELLKKHERQSKVRL
jgi:hypothetical protein